LLRGLGHDVAVLGSYSGQRCDVLVALHARHSADSVRRFRCREAEAPLVLALTGTDVYGDIHTDEAARAALALADRYVVLQSLAVRELPPALRHRAVVVHQSARPSGRPRRPRPGVFEVLVLANLRPVKDPLRAASAARLLPPTSRVMVTHLGEALDEALGRSARAEAADNPRYTWQGAVSHPRAMAHLGGAHLLALTSRTEGGANVISEALATGVPVVASRNDGSVGLLGEGYPGYFEVGDSEALATLLSRAETDPGFYAALRAACDARRPLVLPETEQASWASLLASLVQPRDPST
jgi:putative glycosyltransferase (TIGR04348 family)